MIIDIEKRKEEIRKAWELSEKTGELYYDLDSSLVEAVDTKLFIEELDVAIGNLMHNLDLIDTYYQGATGKDIFSVINEKLAEMEDILYIVEQECEEAILELNEEYYQAEMEHQIAFEQAVMGEEELRKYL